MRYWSNPPFTRRAQAARMLERMREGEKDHTWSTWIVTHLDDARPLGVCSLHHFEPRCRRAELGYILGREHWGQGYMAEAVTAVIEHAFGPLGLRRLEADTDPRNAASIRMLTRLGFVREGTLRERWEVAGEISDTAFYGLLAADWRALHAAPARVTPRRARPRP